MGGAGGEEGGLRSSLVLGKFQQQNVGSGKSPGEGPVQALLQRRTTTALQWESPPGVSASMGTGSPGTPRRISCWPSSFVKQPP